MDAMGNRHSLCNGAGEKWPSSQSLACPVLSCEIAATNDVYASKVTAIRRPTFDCKRRWPYNLTPDSNCLNYNIILAPFFDSFSRLASGNKLATHLFLFI
jgi:hypothetical protein